jgi:uncharacterized SAM-binding protein YcdF (DUF218 family)
MFFALSKVLDFILSPVFWLVVLLFLGIIVKNQKWKRKFIVSGLVCLLFFSNPFISNKVMELWEIPLYNSSSITQPYDIAILLGGSLRYNDTVIGRPIYSHSVDRLNQAISLYKRGKAKKILISGGSGFLMRPNEKESVVLASVLREFGIPDTDIILENESRNTYENAQFSTTIINSKFPGSTVLLITSSFHMRRSVACFEKAGLNVIPFPVDRKSHANMNTPDRILLPDAVSLVTWDIVIHEWVGWIIYKLQGYI